MLELVFQGWDTLQEESCNFRVEPLTPREGVGTQLARSAKSSECSKALWVFLNWPHPMSPS